MRICFVTEGDIEILATAKRATGMASPLIASGHRVGIVMADTVGNRHRASIECPRAEVLYYEPALPQRDFLRKNGLVREYEPDVVWVCSLGVRNAVSRISLPGNVKVVVEHSELSSSIRNRGACRRLLDSGFEWSSLLLYDGVVCASRYLERLFKRRSALLGRRIPIHYSPYAYSPHVISPSPGRGNVTSSRECRRKVVIYMGTFAANYGVFELVRAAAILKTRHADFCLKLLGGSGPDRDGLRSEVSALGLEQVVEFLGYLPEECLSACFEEADAFVSPLNETIQDVARCPSKLFMYLPFGKPIVTCRIGEAAELFGDHGVYYRSGDHADLASVLERVLYGDVIHLGGPYLETLMHNWAARSDAFLQWCRGEVGIV